MWTIKRLWRYHFGRKHWVYDDPEWPKLRKLVFKRDPHKCRNCGATDNLEIDHVLPLSLYPL